MGEIGVHLRVEQLATLIASLSTSQHLLIETALGFQSLAMAKKHHIKMVIDQADEVGEIIGRAIEALEAATAKITILNEPEAAEDQPELHQG